MSTPEFSVDKSHWPEGPWQQEPDYLEFTTQVGLPALIVRHSWRGHLCGYVGVYPGHPLYERDYSEYDNWFGVHGGLSYSAHCDPPICHIPHKDEPGEPWWIGFDMARFQDFKPGERATLEQEFRRAGLPPSLAERPPGFPWEHYRDLEYVKAEVEDLARQLVTVEVPPNGA